MDPEHRHELEENELAEFFRHLGRFWSKWGNSLLFGVLIGLIVVFGLRYFRTTAQRKVETALRELHMETSPGGLLRIAESTDIVSVKAMAYLRGGEALLNRAAMPDPPGTQQPRSQQQRDEDLANAEHLLQQVLELPEADDVFALNAKLALGAVAESRRQWDRATEIYQSVQQAAGEDYPPIAARAQARMAMLDRLQQPVRFATDPLEAEQEAADAASESSDKSSESASGPAESTAGGEPSAADQADVATQPPAETVVESLGQISAGDGP